MSMDEEMLQQLMASFREELAERLTAINADLLALEQGPQAEYRDQLVENLFRHVHSLKGAARAVSLKPIEELAHGMEDVFGAAKRGTIELTPALFDLLYQGIDLIGEVMAAYEAGPEEELLPDLSAFLVQLSTAWREQPIQPPQIELGKPVVPTPRPSVPPGEPPGQPWITGTIRVPTERLDALMAHTGELLVSQLRIEQQLEEIKTLDDFISQWQREWQQIRASTVKFLQGSDGGAVTQLLGFLERNEEHLRALSQQLGHYIRRVTEDANQLALVTDDLQEGVRRVRMLPFATVLGPLRRMVRDLAREKGVQVSLQIEGADTEMDKMILEQLKDPLIHLLRNCIDHGIEPPKQREEQGKPQQGIIRMLAERLGSTITITVEDNGRGIDIDAVRQAAIQRDLIRPEVANEMSDQEALSLVFLPGLSTSPIITEVSGRGLGLDIVRRGVEALQGRVSVSSEEGEGTTFTLTLPLTLVSTHCLLVRIAEQAYALPISAVEYIISVDWDQITQVEGKEAIRFRGQPTSLVRLSDVLRMKEPERSAPQRLPAIILSPGGQRIAFLVDELLGEQEIVVKNLGRQLSRVPNIAGATVLGTGQIVLILNVTDLIKSAQQDEGRSLPPVKRKAPTEEVRKSILIVDDSITTRTLEKNILTTAGYDVHLAIDGEEALAVLAETACDLIVADIDMPRMDGLELTHRVKQDERYRELPVIVVTSLDTPEYKARGIEVGADAYIVKSTFDQDNLLEAIRQLI